MTTGSDGPSAAARCMSAINILAKWRTLFAGWQLGTRAKGDPESDAVSDHREVTLMLRAEVSTLVTLLQEKGVFTRLEWFEALELEARTLSKDYENRFPGVRASEHGLTIDKRALAWMKGWKP